LEFDIQLEGTELTLTLFKGGGKKFYEGKGRTRAGVPGVPESSATL